MSPLPSRTHFGGACGRKLLIVIINMQNTFPRLVRFEKNANRDPPQQRRVQQICRLKLYDKN